MSTVRLSLGAIAIFGLGFALVGACGSSSSKATGVSDAGASDDGNTTVSPSDDSSAAGGLGMLAGALNGVMCGPLQALTALLPGAGGGGGGADGGKCGAGQACCTMLALPPTASCMAIGSCAGTENDCTTGADCSSGQVCCSGSADGGSSMPASDAAAAGGLGGIVGMLGNFLPSTTCQSSCTATQKQQCASDTECPMGQTCNAPAGAAGPFAGFGGGMMPKTCGAAAPEAGTTPPTMDSGTTTTTPEASVVDAPAE